MTVSQRFIFFIGLGVLAGLFFGLLLASQGNW
jgi:hypothetical protein